MVLTASAAGLYGNFGQANYSAAKLGLVGLMNSLKLEGARFDFKLNTVAPLAATRLTTDVFPRELLDRARPEFVVPLVLYLASGDCPVSGEIYNAGLGVFNRVVLASGQGRVLTSEKDIPDPEMIRDEFEGISDLGAWRSFENLQEQVMDLVDRVSGPGQEQTAGGKRGFAEPDEVFAAMPDRFQPAVAQDLDLIFQFRIQGAGGGDWQVAVRNGECEVSKGLHPGPTTTLSMSSEDFLAMMNGDLPAMQAYTGGKLYISRDLMKSQLIEKLFEY